MKNIRAAVVGVGYLGQYHAEKYAAMEGVELVGVADTDTERAREIAGRVGAEAFASYQDLAGLADAVSIAVPTPMHFEVARFFLEAGADVLIEKPVTSTREQAQELIGLAASRGRTIQVGHLERFNPAVRALAGVVKCPLFIEAQRLSTLKPRALNVSVVLDLMIHDIDIACHLAQSPLASIEAAGACVFSDFIDVANARLLFENGCVASITAGRMSEADGRTMKILEADRFTTVDFARRTVFSVHTGDGEPDSAIEGMETTSASFEQADALADELASFIDCLRTGQQPLVTGQTGARALDAALTVEEIIRQKPS